MIYILGWIYWQIQHSINKNSNGDVYLNLPQNQLNALVQEVSNEILRILWFQLDGAPGRGSSIL